MKLQFTQSAQRDLVRLREFIAEKNPSAAVRVSQRLKKFVQRINHQLEMGVNVENIPGVQDLVAGDYIVRYMVLEQDIYILRIWHGKEEY